MKGPTEVEDLPNRVKRRELASSQAASQRLKAMIGSVTILCGLVTHESPHRYIMARVRDKRYLW